MPSGASAAGPSATAQAPNLDSSPGKRHSLLHSSNSCESQAMSPGRERLDGEPSPPSSSLSSSSTCPAREPAARNAAAIDTGEPAASSFSSAAACAVACWPPVSPSSRNKKNSPDSKEGKAWPPGASSPGTRKSPHDEAPAAGAVASQPRASPGRSWQNAAGAVDVVAAEVATGAEGPVSMMGAGEELVRPCTSSTVTQSQGPLAGDSDFEQIWSQSTTAEDTPRPHVPTCTPNNGEVEPAAANLTHAAALGELACRSESGEGRGYTLPTVSRAFQAQPSTKPAHLATNTNASASSSAGRAGGDALAEPATPLLPAATQVTCAEAREQRARKDARDDRRSAATAAAAAVAPLLVGKAPESEPTTAAPARAAKSCATLQVSAVQAESADLPTSNASQAHRTSAPTAVAAAATTAPTQAVPVRGAGESKVGAADKPAAKELPSVRLKDLQEGRNGQSETRSLAPGKAAAGLAKKNDFAAMMAARQQKMREAEEADAGMYFD